jgi:hypothetical protein
VKVEPLPYLAPKADYDAQAQALLAAHRAADAEALEVIHETHPRFLDDEIRWLPRRLTSQEIAAAPFDLEDARLSIARGYSFPDWAALVDHVEQVTRAGSPVHEFESAVHAVITGNVPLLERLLAEHADLVRARSTRRTCHDPSVHGATLLHYIAANGVEGYNQRSPANAVDVARRLLEAGAAVDALAGMYGGQYATMSMLVSSTPPASAGVQVPLIHLLLDFGAAVDGVGSPQWGSNLATALAFGFHDAAEALVQRGARIDNIAFAAGLGRLADAERLLAASDALSRHRALALAAQHGHTGIVKLLLDAGEDPNRYNPAGNHGHSTPLHQAALVGHDDVVRLLVERGASLEIEDTIHHGTPLGWAEYAGQHSTADILREASRPLRGS